MQLVNFEALLVAFISNAISYLLTDHHLAALHKVVHDILKRWLISCKVDGIKVYELIGGDLEPVCVLDIVNGPSDFDCVVKFPKNLL